MRKKGALKFLWVIGGYLFLINICISPFFYENKEWVVGYLFKGDLINTLHIYWWANKFIYFTFCQSKTLWEFAKGIFLLPFRMGVWNITDVVIFGLPLMKMLPFPHWYNMEILIIFFINALIGFWLFYKITKDTFISFLGGLFVSINPFTLHEASLGRPIQVSTFVISLFLIALIDFFKKKDLKSTLILSGTMLLGAYYYWFFLIFFSLATLIIAIYKIYKKEKNPSLLKYEILILILILGILPVYSPFLNVFGNTQMWMEPPMHPFPPLQEIKKMGIPPFESMHPLNPALIVARSWHLFSILDPKGLFPLFILPLTLYLLILKRKKNLEFLWVSAFFYALSLGPYLKIGRILLNIPLPYKFLYHYMPFFSRFYFPYHTTPIVICTSLIYIISNISLTSFKHSTRAILLSIFTVTYLGLLLARGFIPLPHSQIHIPPFYKNVKKGGIIELPFPSPRLGFTNFFQIFHQQKVMENGVLFPPFIGYSKEYDIIYNERKKGNTFINFIDEARKGKVMDGFNLKDELVIKSMGYRWLVLHKYFLDDPHYPFSHFNHLYKVLNKYLGNPIYQDEKIIVFQL